MTTWSERARKLGVPMVIATRELAKEPLTTDDWYAVYLAYQGFLAQIRLIVARAQSEDKTTFAPGYVERQ